MEDTTLPTPPNVPLGQAQGPLDPTPSTVTTEHAALGSARPVRRSSTSSSRAAKRVPPPRGPTTSATNSRQASRESSPMRSLSKAHDSVPYSAPASSRVKKDNVQDLAPTHTASTNATARVPPVALSPAIQSGPSEASVKTATSQNPTLASEARETPRWPISPRLRSPPPVHRPSILSPRKTEHDGLLGNAPRVAQSADEGEANMSSDTDDFPPIAGVRASARGASGANSTLATVQELSQPNTPAPGFDGAFGNFDNNHARPLMEQDYASEDGTRTTRAAPHLTTNESGSESGGKGGAKPRAASAAPQNPAPRSNGPAVKAFSAGGAGRGKPPGEGSTRNMTVETETVSSVPQIAVGVGASGNTGSIRTRPSSETIRPKKEKKKTARKAPSVTSGTVSSKADIFEAKVASAVDEANSSDSEETFVYESNPPDASDRPRRFHSRTPSATSMASQVDQRNGIRVVMDGHHSVAMKKSMKFANSFNSTGPESTTGDEDGKGTARSNIGTGRGTTHHHHVTGRWGRNGGNGHPSLFDNESPFPGAARSKMSSNLRQSPRSPSPRIPNMRMAGSGKRPSPIPPAYDLDDGADDERTPLIPSVRSNRSGRARRPTSSMRQLGHQPSRQSTSLVARLTGCMVLSLMIILVVSGTIGFMSATTQTLSNVKVLALKNVLASEQDVIFDIKVQALNRNLVIVTVDATDLVIFAKSKFAGTDSEYWTAPRPSRHIRCGLRMCDESMDPAQGDDPGASPNLEIGHVYVLDSPLTFEGSPFHGDPAFSSGQIRITHPGNKTVPRGSERWGKVLQHEFDLIVRGTLKYTLPLSQKIRSVSVEGRVTVKPNAADQDPDNAVHIKL